MINATSVDPQLLAHVYIVALYILYCMCSPLFVGYRIFSLTLDDEGETPSDDKGESLMMTLIIRKDHLMITL